MNCVDQWREQQEEALIACSLQAVQFSGCTVQFSGCTLICIVLFLGLLL